MAGTPIDQVIPGMILQSAVRTSTDQLLIAAGMAVTSTHIQLLRSAGIEAVDILPPDESGISTVAGTGQPILSEEQKNKLMRLFAYNSLDDPAMARLNTICAEKMAVNDKHDT